MEKLKSFPATADDPVEDNLSPLKKPLEEKINEGTFANVYGQGDYVIKAGKTEKYTPPILNWLKLNLPREKVSKMLVKIFGPQLKIQPDMEFIENGLAEYALINKYFGAHQTRSSGQGEAGAEADPAQEDENLRARMLDEMNDENSDFFRELLKAAGDEAGVAKLAEVVGRNRDHNFLPKEHLVIGHPASLSREKAEEMQARGEKLPMTYYIIQERIKGEGVAHLFEMDDDELSRHPEIVEKLLTFLVLVKKMYGDTGRLIDTRPEEIGKNPLEWFNKTGNIMVDKETDDVHFVDTRWLWDEKSGLGSGGLNLIKLLGVRSIDKSIKKYTTMLIDAEKPPEATKEKVVGAKDDSISKVRERWDKDDEALIDKQLATEIIVEVKDKSGRPLKIEGRFLTKSPEAPNQKKTLAIIGGWGMSFEGMKDLAKVIVMEGDRPVVLISMPGNGKSDDPPEEWLHENNLENESNVAFQAIEQIRKANGDTNGEVALMGHSMGGMIASTIAKNNPNQVKDLVLAHTAGVRKENQKDLVARFTANAFIHEPQARIKNWLKSGFDPGWKREIGRHTGLGTEIAKNLSSIKRFRQHLGKELKILAAGGLKDVIKDFKGNVLIFSGSGEKLFPMSEAEELKEAAVNAESAEAIELYGAKHSDAMLWAEIYGIYIAKKLDDKEIGAKLNQSN